MCRILFLIAFLLSLFVQTSFAQFHLEGALRLGKATFENRGDAPNMTGCYFGDARFGQSFGFDCSVAYDFSSKVGVWTGLSFDYCMAKDAMRNRSYWEWDVPEDQIPEWSPNFSLFEKYEYSNFVQEHYKQVVLPDIVRNAHVAYLSLPLCASYTEHFTSFLGLRPFAGIANSFLVSKKMFTSSTYEGFTVNYKRYVPAVIGGLDVVLYKRWIAGVHLRYDLADVASPSPSAGHESWYVDEPRRIRMVSLKLAYRIF